MVRPLSVRACSSVRLRLEWPRRSSRLSRVAQPCRAPLLQFTARLPRRTSCLVARYHRTGRVRGAVASTPMPTSSPSAPHVETCGVHFPRLMSDAYAFEL
jgi:hypothetical protein